jgi:hypothetical protein
MICLQLSIIEKGLEQMLKPNDAARPNSFGGYINFLMTAEN